MKNIRYILLVIPMLFMLTACEDFLDVNTDRDRPTAITLEQSLPPLIFFAMQINYDHAEYAAYLSQMLTTAGRAQRGSLAYSSGWDFQQMNRHPMWRRHFFDIGANNQLMMSRALAEGARNYYLIGRTIRLMSTMLTVDAFGDMPHFESFMMDPERASATPRYDTQQAIYRWLFQEVEDLLDRFADPAYTNAPGNLNIDYRIDIIYGGDLAKWAAFAKGLRARLWLRVLPNGFVDEYGNPMVITHRGQSVTLLNNEENARRVARYAEIALNDPHWQEPRFQFTGAPGNHSSPWGPSAPTVGGWESRPNLLAGAIPTSFFADAILGVYAQPAATVPQAGGSLDPRAARIMTARGTPAYFRWLHSNSGNGDRPLNTFPDMTAGGAGATNPFTTNNGYVALMLHEELLFIKAEGLYWAGEREAAFETTVYATHFNMRERWGLVTDVSHLPAANPVRQIFERFMTVRLPGAAQFTIATLMQQKFVAMYLQAEQWTDMRRYNFSSPRNGIAYVTPSSPDGVFVYLVRGIHDTRTGGNLAAFAPARFTAEYALRRPANLWVAVWNTPDNFGVPFAVYSPNAWLNRLNYDPETEPRFNSGELNRIGAMIGTEVVPDWVRNRLIWQFNTSGHAITSNPEPWR